jgi:hypothetical protein
MRVIESKSADVAAARHEQRPGSQWPGAVTSNDATEAPEWLLYHGIRGILRCDEAEIVSELVSYMYAQYRSLRMLSALVEAARNSWLPSVITLLGGVKGFLVVRSPARAGGAIWVARLANERRAIDALPTLAPELDWSEVRLNWRIRVADVVALARAFAPTVRRVMRISRHLHARHASFKVLRVVELIGYYLRYRRIFHEGRYTLAVMSSHSNPHGIAFNLAARRFGVPVVLVTHGMPVRPVARLTYDLAVVHCEDARQTYLTEGCQIRRWLVHGRRQHIAPMPARSPDTSLVVGVFLCKDVNETRLSALLDCLLASPRVLRVLVRAHPFNMWVGLRAWVATRNDPKVHLSAGGSVFDDIAASAVVFAGNTSVHIEAVLAGRPSGYVTGLDHGGHDLHRFVARGLICSMGEPLRFAPDEMLAFYRSPAWPGVLRQFANIDDDEPTVSVRAAAIMRALVQSQGNAR